MQGTLIHRLTRHPEWHFASVLPRAAPFLAVVWWVLLVLRGLLPAGFAVAMGVLITAVQAGGSLLGPLILVGAVFVGLQTLSPLHQVVSKNLGSRTAAWLYDELTRFCVWRRRASVISKTLN